MTNKLARRPVHNRPPVKTDGGKGRQTVKQVNAPVAWQSAPNHPPTHLAYITDAERSLLRAADLHGSGVRFQNHYGPRGLPSFDGNGSSSTSNSDSNSDPGSYGGGSNPGEGQGGSGSVGGDPGGGVSGTGNDSGMGASDGMGGNASGGGISGGDSRMDSSGASNGGGLDSSNGWNGGGMLGAGGNDATGNWGSWGSNQTDFGNGWGGNYGSGINDGGWTGGDIGMAGFRQSDDQSQTGNGTFGNYGGINNAMSDAAAGSLFGNYAGMQQDQATAPKLGYQSTMQTLRDMMDQGVGWQNDPYTSNMNRLGRTLASETINGQGAADVANSMINRAIADGFDPGAYSGGLTYGQYEGIGGPAYRAADPGTATFNNAINNAANGLANNTINAPYATDYKARGWNGPNENIDSGGNMFGNAYGVSTSEMQGMRADPQQTAMASLGGFGSGNYGNLSGAFDGFGNGTQYAGNGSGTSQIASNDSSYFGDVSGNGQMQAGTTNADGTVNMAWNDANGTLHYGKYDPNTGRTTEIGGAQVAQSDQAPVEQQATTSSGMIAQLQQGYNYLSDKVKQGLATAKDYNTLASIASALQNVHAWDSSQNHQYSGGSGGNINDLAMNTTPPSNGKNKLHPYAARQHPEFVSWQDYLKAVANGSTQHRQTLEDYYRALYSGAGGIPIITSYI